MIYLENMMAATLAYFINLGILLLMRMGPDWLNEIVRYYDVFSYFTLLLIILGMSTFVSMRYSRKLFRESVQRTLKTE